MKARIEKLFNGQNVEMVHAFEVLYSGWEMDNVGYVVNVGGANLLILTSHGIPYVAKTEELQEKVVEYTTVLSDTQKALALLTKTV